MNISLSYYISLKILLSNSSAFIRFNLIIALFKAMTTVLLLTNRSKIVEGGLNKEEKIKLQNY